MDIEALLNEIKNQSLAILGENYNGIEADLKKDISKFLQKSKEKLERWALLFADNSIDKDEFEWLIKSQQDLMVLQSLQTAGLSKIKLNKIKNSIISATVKAIILSL
jgi:hypothetical protein